MRPVSLLAPAAFLAAGVAGASAGESQGPNAWVERAIAQAQPGDTIVVRGGRLVDLTIQKDGVTLIGRNGATLAGDTLVTGNGVTLTGFHVASVSNVTIEGDDAVFSKNRVGRRTLVQVRTSDRAHIEGNSFGPAGLEFVGGRDAVVRGNTGSRVTEMIVTWADGARVEGNRIGAIRLHGSDLVVRENRALVIDVTAGHSLIEDNSLVRGMRITGDETRILSNRARGIDVTGDSATITKNTVRKSTFGVAVHGSGPKILGNTLSVGSFNPMSDMAAYAGCPGILVEAPLPGGLIEGNVITHTTGTGIVVSASGMSVTDNVVHGVQSTNSVTIYGDGNTVAGNDISHSMTEIATGNGIEVGGDRNAVRDNHVASAAMDAILVANGEGNSVVGNSVDAAAGCGIAVSDEATGTLVADCTVANCGLGLVNYTDDLSLTGTEFTDNRFADVLDLGTFILFDGNVFETLSHDEFLSPHR